MYKRQGLSHEGYFNQFIAKIGEPVGWHLLFMAIVVLVVLKGVSGGIEKVGKVFMPALFLFLILIAIRSLTLDGAQEGIRFLPVSYTHLDVYKRQVNNIPFARGLGSSSACIIGGLKGANTLLGNLVEDDQLINIAASIEGHPDNSTPALTGGLVTSVMDQGRVYYVKQEIKNDLHFVAIIPDFELKTSRARAVLPDMIPRKHGVFNLSRAALMSVSLYSGNYQNLRVAADDRIHQPCLLYTSRCV